MEILENGYINLIDSMGDDKRIVEAARKSFAHELNADVLTQKDVKLLKYLWNNNHTSPFEMVEFMFEVKAPLFVVREWQRHRTWSYNEVSRRYTSEGLDFYYPENWRLQSKDNKQASYGSISWQASADSVLQNIVEASLKAYDVMIENSVCREQARMVLPQNMMVEMVAKVDLHNLINFLKLRLSLHAQWEIQEYARAIVKLIEPIVPETINLFRRDFL